MRWGRKEEKAQKGVILDASCSLVGVRRELSQYPNEVTKGCFLPFVIESLCSGRLVVPTEKFG